MTTVNSPRILITRLSHIGDCILTLPMVCAIRRKMPNAFIAWAVESPTQHLLGLHPAIDEMVMVPKGWLRKPKAWLQLRKQFKELEFDVAIDPQGITKSACLARISGAKTRIGIKGEWGRELSPYLNNSLVETKAPHIVDRSIELLSALNVGESKVEFRLPVCSKSDAVVRRFVRNHQIGSEFVVINPGASWKSKRWQTDRYATVASHIHEKYGMKSVVTWAGKEERHMADRIVSLNPNVSLIAPATSLPELAAFCQQATFFIGCDTGPLHIATAMGTPCVGMYGTTKPTSSGAYGPQHVAVQKWYQSGSCRKRRRAENDAMRDIMASDVIEACDQIVERIQRTRE